MLTGLEFDERVEICERMIKLDQATARRKLRNQFAAAYLTGIVGSWKPTDNEHKVSKDAFRFAVAMVTESERY